MEEIHDTAGDTGVAAFLYIRGHVDNIFSDGQKTRRAGKEKAESIQWMFCLDANAENEQPRFDDCCAVLHAESWMIRLRTHLEVWKRQVVFSNEIQGFVLPVPTAVVNMAYGCAGDYGIWVCRRLWQWPGMPVSQLIGHHGAPPEGILLDVLEKLSHKGIIVGDFSGHYYYCVGHSPVRPDGRIDQRSWIRLWR